MVWYGMVWYGMIWFDLIGMEWEGLEYRTMMMMMGWDGMDDGVWWSGMFCEIRLPRG